MRKRRDGSYGPLFINQKQRLHLEEWYLAEALRTPGYAFRPGWHSCLTPTAPHLSKNGRVWVEVEVRGNTFHTRPESQGGTWVLSQEMKILREIEVPDVD
jgi:hypothetical protein